MSHFFYSWKYNLSSFYCFFFSNFMTSTIPYMTLSHFIELYFCLSFQFIYNFLLSKSRWDDFESEADSIPTVRHVHRLIAITVPDFNCLDKGADSPLGKGRQLFEIVYFNDRTKGISCANVDSIFFSFFPLTHLLWNAKELLSLKKRIEKWAEINIIALSFLSGDFIISSNL